MSPDSKANAVAAIAALAFLIALIGAFGDFGGGAVSAVVSPQTTNRLAAQMGRDGEMPGDRILGNKEAPITIIEYASLTCGGCAQFHVVTYPQLKETYIDTGQVRLILREFPTAPVDRAQAGFMVARCVPENSYYGFLSVLFKYQNTWAGADNAAEALWDIANQTGMKKEEFDSCLRDEDERQRIDEVTKFGARQYGVNSTPTFIIKGKKYSNMSFQQFQAVLDPLIGG